MRKAILVIAATFLAIAVSVHAEDTYKSFKVGLEAGTDVTELIRMALNEAPESTIFSVGAQVHIIPLLSLRPVLQLESISHSVTDNIAGTTTLSNSDLAVGGRIDALFHLIRLPAGSVYAGPSLGYLRQDTKNYYASGTTSSELTDTELRAGAIFGAQLQIFSNFGFYMESGVYYNLSTSKNDQYNASGTLTSSSTDTYEYVYLSGLTFGFIAYLN